MASSAAARGAGFRNRIKRNEEAKEDSYWIPKGLIMAGLCLEAAQKVQEAELLKSQSEFAASIIGFTPAQRAAVQLKLKNAELTEMQVLLLEAKGKYKKQLKQQVAKLDREVADLHFAIRGVGGSSDEWSVPEDKEMNAAPASKGITMPSSPMMPVTNSKSITVDVPSASQDAAAAFFAAAEEQMSSSPVPKLCLPATTPPAMDIDTKQLEACLQTFREQMGDEAFEAAVRSGSQQTNRASSVSVVQPDIGESAFGDVCGNASLLFSSCIDVAVTAGGHGWMFSSNTQFFDRVDLTTVGEARGHPHT